MAILFFSLSVTVQSYSQCSQLVWFDEFNEDQINLQKWEFQIGNGTNYGLDPGWGNQETQYYTSNTENASIQSIPNESGNKALVITARYAPNYLGSGSNYTSARLRTRGKGDWRYGRFEARIKVPEPFQDSKHWPAFWMLPYNSNWPRTGEIDIMETGKDGLEWQYHGTLHYFCTCGNNQNSGTGGLNIQAGPGLPATDYDLSKQYHIYRVDWSPGLIEWYVDGIKRGQHTPGDLTGGAGDGVNNGWVFDNADPGRKFHLILNMAVNGWFPGLPPNENSRYPLSMWVDWVRVYSTPAAVSITGDTKVLQGETGVKYSVPQVAGNSYNWSVPSGAVITDGQGTNEITVDYPGTNSGNVSVTITPTGSGCVANTVNLPVSVVANTCNIILEDFETNRNLGFNFSTGWMNRVSTSSKPNPFGYFNNPGGNAVNSSTLVGKYERNTGVQYDALAYNDIVIQSANAFKNGSTKFYMDVRSTAPAGTKILVQLENRIKAQTGYPNGIHSTYEAVTGNPNEWTRLEFNLTGTPDVWMSEDEVDQIVVFFGINSYTNHTYFFDNFCSKGVTPATSAITGPSTVCANETNRVYSVTGFEGSTYTWTVPSGATIVSGQGTNSITVNFGTTGGNISVVEKSITNCNGPTKTLNVTLNTSCTVTANFEANNTSSCVQKTVVFTDKSTGLTGTETFSWNFGSGATPGTATGVGPHSVTYTSGGMKTVSLTVNRVGTSDTETKTNYIDVEGAPVGCLFSDDFNNSTVSFVTPVPGAFSHAESGSNWNITNGGYDQWENFILTLNDGSSAKPLNFSCPLNKPILKIRARASAKCVLRIEMLDESGNATDLVNGYNLELTPTVQEYTINYAGAFYNNYGCGGSPCGFLDSSAINRLRFFVNPGYQDFPVVMNGTTYNTAFGGTVTIDWIGIGDNCNPAGLAPTITGFTPTCVSVGTDVTITGTNLTGATAVKFNGVNATITSNTATQIIAKVPAGVTAGKISVTTSGGTATSSADFTLAVTPAVSIALTTGVNPTCSGTPLTFTATPTNGGTTPTYQWKVNGVNAGTGATFSSNSLTNNAKVTCVLTSNAACVTSATANSNELTMTVTNSVTPTINITTASTTICTGTNVTFNATITNGGTNPVYQWKVNGVNAGTGATFSSNSLTNNAKVTCELTSNAACVTSATANSNEITMTVTNSVTPTINITTASTTICAGTNVTFNASITNGGTNPVYQWKVNGVNAGTGATFSTNSLTNNAKVTCELTSNATCVTSATANSNELTMTVTNLVTPTINITTASTTICTGTNVTFNATITNGGTNPVYQWKVNGVNAGTGATFSSNSLTNNAKVTCELTSNATCVTSATANSNEITMIVTNSVTPTINITTASTTICAGTNVTFNATITNGGTNPTYQWKVNGVNAGTGATFSSNSLTNNAKVTCELTSNATCVTSATANSNEITMIVTNSVTPTINITTASPTICAGTNVTFNATITNGGTNPTYQWKVNGVNAGTGATFSSNSLTNNAKVTCVLTSNATCVTSATANSNEITMTVTNSVTPTINITTATTTICAGTNVTFNATITNGGTNPTYQWKVNGVNAGTGATFSSNSLTNNAKVTCELTSNAACVTSATANSNQITMTVTNSVTPTINITTASTTICTGTNVTFNASITNGGTNPTYQWKVNGVNAGTGATFSSNSLVNGDEVTCELTSSLECASSATATSNSIVLTVNNSVTPTISIVSAGPTTVCSGEEAIFDALITNGGSSPSLQWEINGVTVGTGTSFSSTTLENNDKITCVLTSNAECATSTTAISNEITMVVNPTVTPTITITTGSATICSGTNASFTASISNGGGSPAYQWKVNGINVGTGATYNSNTFANNDKVTCILTSNATCVASATATSNEITMTVSGTVAPTVSIAVDGGSEEVCSDATVSFTATSTNGGASPSYQWKVNGVNAGTGATFISSSLADGDEVTCEFTSSLDCANPTSASSNTIIISVNNSVTPTVSITASGSTTICSGTSVTFNATSTNGGATPVYQWKVNGGDVGTGTSFTSNSLNDNDKVTCVLTSNAVCATSATATSNEITMTVNPSVTPSVTITASETTICSGTSVTFTAVASNEGTTPVYQWKVNGANVGSGASFSSNTLSNNDVVTCELTSNAVCATSATATSNEITISVSSTVVPTVSIAVDGGSNEICTGESLSFTAASTNGGTSPAYQWKVNGADAGTGTTFSSSELTNGDLVTCELTSSLDCANPLKVTSNTVSIIVTGSVTPAVTISSTGSTTICSGSSITFNATPLNGGSTPTYQWKVNGNDAGTGASFTSNTLANNDKVTCVLTSSASCVTTATASSNEITVTVNASVTPTITIATSTSTICSGTSVTFTASVTNEGTNPAYQWEVNGATVGTGATFNSNTLSDGDVVNCVLTSNAACLSTATATSNQITMTVSGSVIPSLSIVASKSAICSGEEVTFSASATNAGSTPSYQWKINGEDAGTSGTFSSSGLSNGDVVSCVLTSSLECASPVTATSNTINITVTTAVTPTVSISPNGSTTICEGESISFTATSTNGGTSPVYQWKVNGVNASTGASFSSSALNNGDLVSCQLTSSENCVTSTTAISNEISVTVNNSVTPTINISANGATTICQGTNVSFSANIANGGNAPTYQWKVNGVNAGTGATFSSTSLNNNDKVTCEITSNASCVTSATATSNEITITVSGAVTPQVAIAITSGSNSICNGTSVTFTASPIHGGTTPSYQWKVNGSIAGTGVMFTSTSLNDNDVITCELTSSLDCASQSTVTSNSITMNVDTKPVANAGADKTVGSSSTTLAASITSGSGVWSVISGTGTFSSVSDPSATVTGLSSGQNIFKWTVTSGLCSSEDEVVITYNATQGLTMSGPTEVEVNYTYTFSVPSLPGATYSWTVPDGATIIFGANSNTIHVIFKAHSSGQVTCVRNGSETAVKTVTVKTATGIADAERMVEVYPNPFVDATTLYLNNTGNKVIIQITDVNGVLVKEINTTDNEITISDDFTGGVYFVHIMDNNNVQRKPVRLVKLR